MLIINRRKTVLENNQTVELSVTDFRRYYSIFANFMRLCHNKKIEWNISNSQVRENEDSINIVKLRGSIKEKVSTSLIIKSANLQLLDPIGQG